MQQQEQYRCIWLSGNQSALLAGIRAHLRTHHSEEAVRDLDLFIWNSTEFAIRHAADLGAVITVPVNGTEDASSWNEQLRDFYEQIVRPVADKTGGVTVGLAEPGALYLGSLD